MKFPRNRKTAAVAGAVLVAAVAGGGAAIAAGGGPEGPDRPITGDALAKASAAALDHTGGGKVTATETGDEESLYEVEVTRADGSQVDVQLDSAFKVVGASEEGPDNPADDGPNGPDDDAQG